MVQTTVSVPWRAREADSKEARPEEKAGASIVVGVRVQEVRVAKEVVGPEKEKNSMLSLPPSCESQRCALLQRREWSKRASRWRPPSRPTIG